MSKMSSELMYAMALVEASMARHAVMYSGRVEDRRVRVVAIEHEDRRKGPRRMAETRALLATRSKEQEN